MNKSLSLIIPTYNRSDILFECLNSIGNSDISDSVEVLVIDQSDNAELTKIKLSEVFEFANFFYCPVVSLPFARNFGVSKSSTDTIIFIDDDIRIGETFFSSILRILDEYDDYSIFTGKIIQKGNSSWEDISEVFFLDKKDGLTHANFSLDYNGEINSSTGGFFCIKRKVFDKTSGFDCRFKGNHQYEDIDFFYRAQKKGFKIFYSSRITTYHFDATRGGCHYLNGPDYYISTIHNRTLFYIRHIRIIPRLSYLKSLVFIVEFLSRKKNGGYNIKLILKSSFMFFTAYKDLLLGVKR